MYVNGELKNAQPEFFTTATLPDASLSKNRNRLILNTDTKQLLVSDGTRWVPQGTTGGSKNYLQNSQVNPDFEGNTVSPWSAFTTTLSSGVPTTITASATQMAIAVTATTPLAGSYSMQLTKSAANAVGQGFISAAFTIDREDLGKVLTGSFFYEKNSGTIDLSGTSTQSLEIWVYNVTAAQWIQPTGYRGMNQGTGTGKVSFTFQSDATAANNQYRIAVFTAQTDTNAYVVEFDDFVVSPQTVVQGTPVTDWTSFTPTGSWVTNVAYTGVWRRVGKNLEARCRVTCSGAPTSATLTFTLPFGLQMDTSVINPADDDQRIGYGSVLDNGVTRYLCFVNTASATTVKMFVSPDTAAGRVQNNIAITQAEPFTFGASDLVDVTFSVPILGWSSNVQMSNDTDTRVVAARVAGGTPAGTISTVIGSSTNVTGMLVTFDTHSSFSSNSYTIPVSGVYEVFAQLEVAATYTANQNAFIGIMKNGSLYDGSFTRAATSMTTLFPQTTQLISCVAGDVLTIRCTSNGTTPTYGTTTPVFSVKRLSGPSVVAANEAVIARYNTTAAPSIANNTDTTVNFATKALDTHNAVTVGASWVFTAPVSGRYLVNAKIAYASSAWTAGNTCQLNLKKNGSSYALSGLQSVEGAPTSIIGRSVTEIVEMNAGDTISVSTLQVRGAATSLTATATENYISIARIG